MEVIKRDGTIENVSFDKITIRIHKLCQEEPCLNGKYVNPVKIAQETINGLYDRITTQQLDLLSADICASKIQQHPDFGKLASRILISNLHKSTSSVYFDVVSILKEYQVISDAYYQFVKDNELSLHEMIDYRRDYLFDFFGFKTLERSYLLKIKEDGKFKIVERPQMLWMRVAIQIHGLHPSGTVQEKLNKIRETYNNLSMLYFTHATPTLFNSGGKYPQLSSCFLASIDDNLSGIFKTIGDLAQISKWAGGIGIHLSSIRGKGSLIKGTNGTSDGIIPLCKVLEGVARYIDQGGKRKGSIACYLEPWHLDIQEFVDLRKNTGDENLRTRDLFLALWVPDLFMRRVQEDGVWSLMSSDVCPGLNDTYGEEFEKLYLQYEAEGKFGKQIKAMELWKQILEAQIETGMPYILYKDHVNYKSNQKNLGTIKSSNLCVDGDTLILTKEKGWIPIHQADGLFYHIWNGIEWSKSLTKKTSNSSFLREIQTSDGCRIRCTNEHQFILEDGSRKDASQLKLNDKLKSVRILPISSNPNPIKLDNKIYHSISELYNEKMIFFNNGGYIYSSGGYPSLLEAKLFFQQSGINPKIEEHQSRLIFNLDDLRWMEEYEFQVRRNTVRYIPKIIDIYVTSNQVLNLSQETYCFGEPSLNQGMFNGLIIGNCAEIVEYSDKDNIAVCNLASICLPRFVEDGKFNYEKLGKISGIVTENLNKVIDLNFYPVSETRNSNFANRPIGIGVQGLADVFCKLKISFESEEAREINRKIFEVIYYSSLKKSIELAEKEGPYSNFQGSPFSQGIFQFDMWGKTLDNLSSHIPKEDWEQLRKDIQTNGIRNSLLTAVMPTASTSQIMGNSECIEPYSSNIFVRKTLAGEYTVVNDHLIKDLLELELWTKEIYEEILYFNGSIQKIREIPDEIKERYKTAFEIKGISIVKQAVERGPFIDQTQSMNLFQEVPNFDKLSSSHFYSWKNGLKTGMYYLRTKPIVDPIKFGLEPTSIQRIKEKYLLSSTQSETQEDQTQIRNSSSPSSSSKNPACVWKRGMRKAPEDCEVCSS